MKVATHASAIQYRRRRPSSRPTVDLELVEPVRVGQTRILRAAISSARSGRHLVGVVRCPPKRGNSNPTERIAVTLGLSDDYFIETREQRVIERLHEHPELVDRILRRATAEQTQLARTKSALYRRARTILDFVGIFLIRRPSMTTVEVASLSLLFLVAAASLAALVAKSFLPVAGYLIYGLCAAQLVLFAALVLAPLIGADDSRDGEPS